LRRARSTSGRSQRRTLTKEIGMTIIIAMINSLTDMNIKKTISMQKKGEIGRARTIVIQTEQRDTAISTGIIMGKIESIESTQTTAPILNLAEQMTHLQSKK